MALNYIPIFFVTAFIGTECRSIISSNLNQVVEASENREASKENFMSNSSASADVNDVINMTNENREFVGSISNDFSRELDQLITTQGLTIESLLSEFVARAANVTDQKDTAAQWLEQLKLVLEELPSGIQIDKSSITEANDIRENESTTHEGNKNFIFIGGNNWLEDLQEFLNEQYIDMESSEDNESDDESRSMDSSTLYSSDDPSFEETEDTLLEQYDPEQSDNVNTELPNDISGTRKPFGKLCRKHRTAS